MLSVEGVSAVQKNVGAISAEGREKRINHPRRKSGNMFGQPLTHSTVSLTNAQAQEAAKRSVFLATVW